MKVFVTGAKGQLGYDVISTLKQRGHIVVGSDIISSDIPQSQYISLDLTNKESVFHTINKLKPDAVIHCAAWTAVDMAEDENNIHKVFDINANATEYIACACKQINSKMVYISTDYVFGDDSELPRQEDSKKFAPLNIYGKSKLAGETAVEKNLEQFFIIRISWVFGKNGNNFVKTMLKLSEKLNCLRVINDQIGSPTYTADLSRLIADMIESENFGHYHATNEGEYISWYDFACEIFKQANINIHVEPVTTEEYGTTKAMRPKNSRLSKSKLASSGFTPLPHWKDALSRYLQELKY